MFSPQEIFLKNYPQANQIYNCLLNNIDKSEIKKIEIETYSHRANNFGEKQMLSLSPELQSAIKPLTKLAKDSIILELAGGDGRFAFYLMKQGYRVIESDIAIGPVLRVKEVAEKNNINNGLYAVIDAENLPFKDNSIDAVFMVASLHHMPNPGKVIKEVNRVLKDNSPFLILREPASWQYYFFGPLFFVLRKFLRKKNKNFYSLADDVTWGFSKKKLENILSANFDDINIRPVHYLRKIYTNWLVLKSKIFKNSYTTNSILEDKLMRIDSKYISKIPIIKYLPWDWDIYAIKKRNNNKQQEGSLKF